MHILTHFTLKMEAIRSSETLVTTYNTTQRRNQEGHHQQIAKQLLVQTRPASHEANIIVYLYSLLLIFIFVTCLGLKYSSYRFTFNLCASARVKKFLNIKLN
jgi:hypothetical protein